LGQLPPLNSFAPTGLRGCVPRASVQLLGPT
jgi:hypothetical protein